MVGTGRSLADEFVHGLAAANVSTRGVFAVVVLAEGRLLRKLDAQAHCLAHDAPVLFRRHVVGIDAQRIGDVAAAQAHVATTGRPHWPYTDAVTVGGGERNPVLVEEHREEMELDIGMDCFG
ncbi:hypothetical protein D9M70_523710 [compost metagenome]